MDQVLAYLKNLGIIYKLHEHPAVFTVAEADQYYKDVDGGKSKNLFLRNKNKSNYYLVILEGSKRLQIDTLRTKLNESKLSFASPEELKQFLGLTRGSVSPFGLIHDTRRKVKVIIDENLWRYDRLHYHPNVNTATLELNREDFKKFLDSCGNTVIFAKI